VAAHGLTDVRAQLIESFAFGKNRMAEGTAVNPPSGASSTRKTISLMASTSMFGRSYAGKGVGRE
jgi:hypothetical protein